VAHRRHHDLGANVGHEPERGETVPETVELDLTEPVRCGPLPPALRQPDGVPRLTVALVDHEPQIVPVELSMSRRSI